MKVEPTDKIDGFGLSGECLDILRQAGIETSKQFVEVEWADVATICGATPRKLYAIFRARDQIKTSLGVVDKQAMPVEREQARSAAQPVKAIGAFDAVQASFTYQPEGGLSFNYS